MQKLLLFFALTLPLFANGQSGYISTNGDIIIQSGGIEIFDNPDIYCDAVYRARSSVWVVTINLSATGAGAGLSMKTAQINITKATMDALTCAGATNSDKTQNCVLQAVKNYLLVLNPSITFTLN